MRPEAQPRAAGGTATRNVSLLVPHPLGLQVDETGTPAFAHSSRPGEPKWGPVPLPASAPWSWRSTPTRTHKHGGPILESTGHACVVGSQCSCSQAAGQDSERAAELCGGPGTGSAVAEPGWWGVQGALGVTAAQAGVLDHLGNRGTDAVPTPHPSRRKKSDRPLQIGTGAGCWLNKQEAGRSLQPFHLFPGSWDGPRASP